MAQGNAPRPFFYLAGFGGTGKTYLASHLAQQAGIDPSRIGGGAMQANAALVLQGRTGWDCRTMHRWLTNVRSFVGGPCWFEIDPDSPARHLDLFVIDELSLVPPAFWDALLALNVPVLAMGDPGQLQAIGGMSVARTLASDAFLTEIHRQAQGNPIVEWSLAARQGVPIPFGEFRDRSGEVRMRKVPLSSLSAAELCEADQVLVWKNDTRRRYNEWFREARGLAGKLPQKGERMVCLKNQAQHGLVNGFNATVLEDSKSKGAFSYLMSVRIDETGVIVPNRACLSATVMPASSLPPSFLQKTASDFDYGYCKTVSKFIGCQAPHVLLIDEYSLPAEGESWRYVGISRATERLTIAAP